MNITAAVIRLIKYTTNTDHINHRRPHRSLGYKTPAELYRQSRQVRIFDAAIPLWAQHPDTPGIVEMFRADGGHSCGGQFVPGDHDQSCYVDLGDFALVALEFLTCYNINDPACD